MLFLFPDVLFVGLCYSGPVGLVLILGCGRSGLVIVLGFGVTLLGVMVLVVCFW